MGDTKKHESLIDLIQEARENVLAKEKKERKKTSIADGVTKSAKAIDVWTPTNVFRFSLAGLLTVVKLGLTSSVALANVSWWWILLPAYVLEGILVAALLALGLLAGLYLAVMAVWTAFQILVLDPIQRRRFRKKIDAAAHSPESRGDILSQIHSAMLAHDGEEQSH